MKTTARFFLFLAAIELALGQPMIPVNNISPVGTDSLIGKIGASGRAQNIPIGSGLAFVSGALTATGGAGDAPANATYITQTPNATLTNEQPLSLLSTGLVFVTTGTGVLTSLVPGTSGNVATSNGTSWISSAPAGDVTAGGTLTSGNIVIGQGAKSIATSSVFSISGSNATVTGNLAVTGGMTLNNLTTSNFTITGNVTATGVGNGTLLIGNTTGTKFDVATLTQGSGVTITNGAGSITISATGTGGTVTASGTPTSGQLAEWTSATNIRGITTANVTQGGTGLATIPANAVITGNGTGAVTSVAPGTNGNILTSNGTAWTSAAAPSGNVTGSSLTANAIVLGSGSSAITVLASLGNSGAPLLSAGAGAPPAFGAINLAGGSNVVTGNVPVANGGTGTNTLTANAVVTGNGTGSVTFVAPGTNGNVLTSNGTAWTSAAATGGATSYILIEDRKTAGTNGGDFVRNGWRQRDLTSETWDTGNYASISGNQITLLAGTYRIEAWAMCYGVDQNQLRFRNITDSSDTVIGISHYASVAGGVNPSIPALLRGRFIIASTKVFELQHWCEVTQLTNGFGIQAGSVTGLQEIFTSIELVREP